VPAFSPAADPMNTNAVSSSSKGIATLDWRTRTPYEWVHHVRLARTYGVDAGDVAAIAQGDSELWSPLERDLVSATDQLLDHYRIDDDTWGRLRGQLNDTQLVELPFIVGTYTSLAMAFNSWELQVEDGVDTSDVPPLLDRPTRAGQ
jgi:4-carboxymuconolactone decarboxylase